MLRHRRLKTLLFKRVILPLFMVIVQVSILRALQQTRATTGRRVSSMRLQQSACKATNTMEQNKQHNAFCLTGFQMRGQNAGKPRQQKDDAVACLLQHANKIMGKH